MQGRYWILRIVWIKIWVLSPFSVCGFCTHKDGRVNECSYNFCNHSITTENHTETFCAKVFQNITTWDKANAQCRITISNFTSRIHQNSSLHLELLNSGITVLWVGIRRKGHFFINETSSEIFKEKEPHKNDSWGALWSRPALLDNDCVVLDISTGTLSTKLCSLRFPFVCDRRGTPDSSYRYSLCSDDLPSLSKLGKKCFFGHMANSYKKAEEQCKHHGGRLAIIEEYVILNEEIPAMLFHLEGYWIYKGKTKFCKAIMTINNTSALDNSWTHQKCSRKLQFFCAVETENVRVWITSDAIKSGFIPSFPLTNPCKISDLFICNVEFSGKRAKNAKVKGLLFQWYKDDLPVKNFYTFRISFLGDMKKYNSTSKNAVTWQGSYHCEVMIVGSSKSFSSSKVDFLYSDIATYVVAIDGVSTSRIKDYSEYDFGKFLANFASSTMDKLTEKLNHGKVEWDFRSISVNNSTATMKVLLYIYRDDTGAFNDEKAYQDVKMLFKNHLSLFFEFFNNTNINLTVSSADVCFSKEAKSTDTCPSNMKWPTSLQTINVLSDPICLDGHKRLVQRQCKASLDEKAKWSAFNCSSCEEKKEKTKILDAEFLCPDGYTSLKNSNSCYKIHLDARNWHDASNICAESSSYILNFQLMNELLDIGIHTDVWTSYKYLNGKIQNVGRRSKATNFIAKDIIGKYKPEFHCVSAILENGTYNMQLRNCSEELLFVCLKHSSELVSSVKFSNTWIKVLEEESQLSAEEPCYYFFDNPHAININWNTAQKACQRSFQNAHLSKGIYNLTHYRYLKKLIHQLFNASECQPLSWWIDFLYNKEFLRNSSVLSDWEYADWHPDTNFALNDAYGALTLLPSREILLTLEPRSRSFKTFGFICEIEKCDDNRPTKAYVEDRSSKAKCFPEQNYITSLKNFNLRCIPSGWFSADSFAWYKDGVILNAFSDQFSFSYQPPISLEEALVYEGYYSCSVDQIKQATREFSSEVLFKIPGIHTFVLSLKSRKEFYMKKCGDFRLDGRVFLDYGNTSFMHNCFPDYFKKTFPDAFNFLLRNISCNSSHADFIVHIHYKKDSEEDEIVFKKTQTSKSKFFDFSEKCGFERTSVSVRSTVACYREESVLNNEKITWPTTRIGETTTADKLCLTDEGALFERKCLGDFNTGAVWSPIPFSTCKKMESGIAELLYKNVDVSSLPSSLELRKPENLKPADIQIMAKVLTKLLDQKSFEPEDLTSISEVVNSVMNAPRETLKQSANSFNEIIESLEHVANNVDIRNGEIDIGLESFSISVRCLDGLSYNIPNCAIIRKWSQNITTHFNVSENNVTTIMDDFTAAVFWPTSLVRKHTSDRVVYKVRQKSQFWENVTVVSAIIDVSFGNSSIYDVSPPIQLYFKVNKSIVANYRSSLKCVFLDQRLNNNKGGWSYKGCLLKQSEKDLVSCSCNHLTSFTIILDFNLTLHDSIPHVHKAALALITYIGCTLSCLGLGVIILTFLIFREWRKSLKNKALFYFSTSLICFLILFMVGVGRTHQWHLCIAIAATLHYLLLSTFAWMLISAFLMYRNLVRVLPSYIPSLIQKFMLFAYGMPAVIVIIVLSHKPQLYHQENYCWLSQEAFYYAIATPILVMLTANSIIFGIIFYANTCGKSDQHLSTLKKSGSQEIKNCSQESRKATIARTKALVIISVLLGLSWIFGFLAHGDNEIKYVFQYLFAITTSLQGFLCFIFFIARQRPSYQLWLNFLFPSSRQKKMSRVSHATGSTTSNKSRDTDIQETLT